MVNIRKTSSKSHLTSLKKNNTTLDTPTTGGKKRNKSETDTRNVANHARERANSLPFISNNNIAADPDSRTSTNGVREKIKIEDIENAIKGVIKFHSENPKLRNELFQDICPLFLQISFIKLPIGHSKILRIPVPNSILPPDHEICLIVPEVKGIKNTEHEKHVEHYEELLRNKGVTNIKKIMTCHELRTEFETFEQKSRLVDLYDIFLVDGKVSGKVVKKCGKIFYKKRKVPIPVKLHVTKLKEHIETSLSKVFFFLHLKGDSYSVQFGHDQMETNKLIENIYIILEFLEKQFHGGFENIKGVQVHAPRATSIPVYLSFKSPNEIPAPVMNIRKPKSYKTYKDELTTMHNAEVTVKPTGEVLVNRIRKSQRIEHDDIITDLDILQDDTREVNNEGGKTKNKSRKRKSENKQHTVNADIKKKRKIIDESNPAEANNLVKENILNKKPAKNQKSKNQDINKNINKNATKEKDKLQVKSKTKEVIKQNKGGNKKRKLSIYK